MTLTFKKLPLQIWSPWIAAGTFGPPIAGLSVLWVYALLDSKVIYFILLLYDNIEKNYSIQRSGDECVLFLAVHRFNSRPLQFAVRLLIKVIRTYGTVKYESQNSQT